MLLTIIITIISMIVYVAMGLLSLAVIINDRVFGVMTSFFVIFAWPLIIIVLLYVKIRKAVKQ